MSRLEITLYITGIIFHVAAMVLAARMMRGHTFRRPAVVLFLALLLMLTARVAGLINVASRPLAALPLYRSIATPAISAMLFAAFFYMFRLAQAEQESKIIASRRALERDDARSRLDLAMTAGDVGTWVWDIQSDHMSGDENFSRIHCIPTNHARDGNRAACVAAIHPDDQPRAVRDLEQTLAGNASVYQAEYRVRHGEESYRWVMCRGKIDRDSHAKPVKITGIILDITERKQAEQRLSTLAAVVENTGDFVGIFTPEMVPIYLNEAGQRMVGLNSTTEVLETTFLDYFWPDDRPRIEHEAIPQLLRDGKWSGEVRCRNFKTDQVIHFILNIFAIKDRATGEPIAWAAISPDLTHLRNMEAALRLSTDQVALATDAAALGTFDFNPVTGELHCSDRCRAFFGLTPDGEVNERMFMDKLHPDDLERVFREAESALDTSGPGSIDTEYRIVGATGGAHRWIRAKGRAFFDSVGAVRVVGTVQDVTGQKRNEAEREQLLQSERMARSTAERASRMKDEFLATLSHELRTPLNAILGWSQILRHASATPKDLAQGLETIERNARAQTRLIEDLLDMSRIVSGKLRLDVQPVDAISFIEAAMETVRPAAQAKGIVLQTLLDPAAGPLSGDPQRLQQVVWNLLSNAIKFTPKEGKVTVQLARVNSHVEISVSDTGQGIEPEFLPHVFERFQQADASTTRAHGGLGLGLAIVKHLVELHGGSVKAASPGAAQGSTFTLLFPIAAAHARSNGDERLHPTSAVNIDGDHDHINLGGLKVLAVDDEPDAQDLIRRILEKCGAEVQTSGSASEALEVFRTFKPDVLISDIGMPELDGYEFLRRVRALDSREKTPAIALTAFARSEDRTRALHAGFRAHVAKPVEPAELIATVASISGRT